MDELHNAIRNMIERWNRDRDVTDLVDSLHDANNLGFRLKAERKASRFAGDEAAVEGDAK